MNRDKAIHFIEQNGSDTELARLHYWLEGKRPSAAIIQQLFSGQRQDGGFAPFWAPKYSSIDATCYRLAQAEQLGLDTTEPALANATQFLMERQGKNGRFAEDTSLADSAPPWAAPGDMAAELYLTANAGFWLAYFGAADTARLSANLLAAHLDAETNKLPSFTQAQWLTCGLAWRLGMSDMADRLASSLNAHLPQSASELAWMLTTLISIDYPRERDVITNGIVNLAKMQREDGRFPNEEGQTVHTTLEALRTLKK